MHFNGRVTFTVSDIYLFSNLRHASWVFNPAPLTTFEKDSRVKMDILKRHREFINHLVQFVGYCYLKECLEDVNSEPSHWHMTLKGTLKSM